MSLHLTYSQLVGRLDSVKRKEDALRRFYTPVKPSARLTLGKAHHRYADVLEREPHHEVKRHSNEAGSGMPSCTLPLRLAARCVCAGGGVDLRWWCRELAWYKVSIEVRSWARVP